MWTLHRRNDNLVRPLAAEDHTEEGKVTCYLLSLHSDRTDLSIARDLNTQVGRPQVTVTIKTFERAEDTILVTNTLSHQKLNHVSQNTSSQRYIWSKFDIRICKSCTFSGSYCGIGLVQSLWLHDVEMKKSMSIFIESECLVRTKPVW